MLNKNEHIKMLRIASSRANQRTPLGVGIEVRKDNGMSFFIGDMVELSEPINEPYAMRFNDGTSKIVTGKAITGILTLILDQGVCLIGDQCWFIVSLSQRSNTQWKLISSYNNIKDSYGR